MGDTKTVFKYFTIPQYRQLEEYLSFMHRNGWKLNDISSPGLYHFDKCAPEAVSYRLDYNKEGIRSKREYVRKLAAYGWEHVGDFVGYSCFRKTDGTGSNKEDLFCNDATRLDMMKRVFRGRIIPLIFLFAMVIMPQLMVNAAGLGINPFVLDIVSFVFLGLAIVYLAFFSVFAYHFCQYEKKVSKNPTRIKIKYYVIYSLIGLMVIGIVAFYWLSFRSVYKVEDREKGYYVDAEQLNDRIIREYDLKKGDVVYLHVTNQKGYLYIEIGEAGKEPVFSGNVYDDGVHSIYIDEGGHYSFEVSGNRCRGTAEIDIR